MKWHRIIQVALVVIVLAMFTSVKVEAEGPQPPIERLEKPPSDIAPYDRITGFDFHPTCDYNRDGHINAFDSFIEVYHHQSTPVVIELGVMRYWECANALYSTIRTDILHCGYNRFYSHEFYRFNTGIHAVTVRDATQGDDFIDWLFYESLYQSHYPIVDYSGTTEYMGFHLWSNELGMFDPHLEPYLPYGYRRPILILYLKTDCEDGFTDTVGFLIRVIDLDTGMEYIGQFRQSSRMRDEDFTLFGNHTARVRIWNMKYLPNSARVELYPWWGSTEPFYWCEWGI